MLFNMDERGERMKKRAIQLYFLISVFFLVTTNIIQMNNEICPVEQNKQDTI